MERRIRVGRGEEVAVLDARAKLFEGSAQILCVPLRQALGRASRDQRLEVAANLEDLDGLLDRDEPDSRAAVVLALHQALLLEADERGADRRAAGAERFGEGGLDEALVGLELPRDDGVSESLVGCFG
jgi:hypothetical protein